ncbi:hypothetical protein D0469_05030 [Peribacillus saganii]|uniref:YugN-like family protein n=1 Tax=Peribacillus saganii TaxID=2303992 RepID=A0A372LSL7_9BACI|nr:YugN-like family protein [Peribacillus saganii]RFU70810.1 hypothetical protein D0469_05030 [Peribacillus saganii]
MKELSSKLEGQVMELYKLEQILKPKGYDIGGGWEYDSGYFDYKINEQNGYQFLRIPFEAADGQLDERGVTVRLGKPFLLAHQYQDGLDEDARVGNLSASVNQFQEPANPDAPVSENYVKLGQSLIKDLEQDILGE